MTDPCVFCEIAEGRAPAQLVEVWDDALAFRPLAPVTEGHVLVIPRAHVVNFTASAVQTSYIALRAAELVRSLPEADGWNLITSAGDAATQTIMHLHVHLVPRRPGDGLALPWTPPVALAPDLTVSARDGLQYEFEPMEVIGMSTRHRETDRVEVDLRLITTAERLRRRAATAERIDRRRAAEAAGETVPGSTRFVELCNRLYKELGQDTGGPLHTQLEDTNMDHMVGPEALRTIMIYRNALALIARGEAPDEFDYRHAPEYTSAHFYKDNPAALECAVEILEITQHWTEDQAWEVYRPWAATIYGPDGWLRQRRDEAAAPDA